MRELVNRQGLLQGVLETPFVSSRVAGQFTLRDLKILSGELKHKADDERPPPQRGLVDAAFAESEPDDLEAMADALAQGIAAANDIQSFYTTQLGAVDAPDLSELIEHIEEVQHVVGAQMARLGLTEPDENSADGSSAPGARGQQAITGEIGSREDVLRLIDKICLFYEQQEPSSPVPILMKRAASLVNKSFMDIVADLTPSGVSEAKRYAANNGDASVSRSSGSSSSSWTSSGDEGNSG